MKFLARNILDLNTPEAIAGRRLRDVKFVVDVEVDDGTWCELDATSENHAKVLAQNWVEVLGARGASCWCIMFGEPGGRPFYTHFQDYDYERE
jgi:hypothetical protein